MERITVSQPAVEAVRAEYAAGVANGQDDDLDDRIDENGDLTQDPTGILLDRRDRPAVAYYQDDSSDRWLPTTLKPDDDILMYGCVPGRVIGAARGRDWIAVWVELSEESYDHYVMTAQAIDVTDRAPVDPNESPVFPIIPEAVQARMMAAGTAKKSPSDKHDQHDRDKRLKAVIASLPPRSAKSLREYLRKHGALGKGD